MKGKIHTGPARAILCLTIIITFLWGAKASADSSIPNAGWNERTHEAVTQWIDGLASQRPETLIAVADCDNTVWGGDIAVAMVEAAFALGLITEATASIDAKYPKPEGMPVREYGDWLYDIDAVLAYNYSALMFAGMTLGKTHEIFEIAKKEGGLPVAYPEIKAVLEALMDRGITVGFVSASTMFMIAPMLEEAGYGVPLWQMEGLDIYVEDPRDKKRAVLLSDLVQTSGISKWSKFLSRYGHLKIIARASEAINAREGKALGVISIAARHVWNHNRGRDRDKLSYSDMRLAGIFGDNYAPFTDMAGAGVRAAGNDQGLARSLPYVSTGGLVLNIYQAVKGPDGRLDLKSKRAKNRRFLALVKQLKRLGIDAAFVNQIGIYTGTGQGTFSPHPIPASQQP